MFPGGSQDSKNSDVAQADVHFKDLSVDDKRPHGIL